LQQKTSVEQSYVRFANSIEASFLTAERKLELLQEVEQYDW
jgi:hypothetical protein